MREQTTITQRPAGRGDESVFLSGIEALARLPIEQRRSDVERGLNTAGFVSGYRGSPLAGLDRQLWKLKAELDVHDIVFQPGVNEDLAATAVWGSQQVGLFPGARCDGVFGMWYGKAPGLDRSCDALRHANAAGTSPLGGALLVVGDDPGCKSSTLPSASEFALRDLGIPVLAPADAQDVLDFGLFGWALSRYAGCWAALVVVADVADGALGVRLRTRRHALPQRRDDPHIRLADAPLDQEARLHVKQRLVAAFAAANGVNRIVADCRRPRLAVVTAGKVHADVLEALARLGLRNARAIAEAGIRLAKLGMTWPLDAGFVAELAGDCERLLVLEAKRPFVADQLKAMLFDASNRPQVIGVGDGAEATLPGELDVPTIARALTARLGDVPNRAYLDSLDSLADARAVSPRSGAGTAHVRKPLYCAGCPHNISTRVPAGSRAVAGIGCHYMAQWMDRNTSTPTHMGAEGANWIGQAPFTNEKHLFVNLGDGTFFHSGILAIRAAVAAGINVTYKILANDAVAMTGGQPVDGSLTVADIVAQVQAEGVADVQVVADDPRKHRGAGLHAQAAALPVHGREALDAVQRRLRETPGCTVLVYDQTCATELRRRRKRARLAEASASDASRGRWRKAPRGKADVRVVINDALCEGCGDCSTQSSCIAVVPLATEHGTKRTIDQSACNQDLACLAGFCPALVAVKGDLRERSAQVDVAALRRRLPVPRTGDRADILIAGVGGTGVVTVSRLVAMAAHLDGKFASSLDMTGLAQKGGAVLSHVRISPQEDRHAPTRISATAADAVLAADLVAAASDALPAMSPQRTTVFANERVAATAEFVLRGAEPDADVLRAQLRKAAKRVDSVDAVGVCSALFGSTAFANVVLLGFAFQKGAVAASVDAVERAIAMNGTAVEENLAAFHCGRAVAHDRRLLPESAWAPGSSAMQPPASRTFDERMAARRAFLTAYQDEALAARYSRLVARVRTVEQGVKQGSTALTEAVAESYFKLLAVKDEYEVARLFTQPPAGVGAAQGSSFAAKLAALFEPGAAPTFYFAPPWLARGGREQRPKKIAVAGWLAMPILRLLAKVRRWRGSWLDPFRYGSERQLAQLLLRDFENDCEAIMQRANATNLAVAVALARWPVAVRGFGAVKSKAASAARAERQRLLAKLLVRRLATKASVERTESAFPNVA